MLVHNCQEQEKDYDIYLKSEKLVHSKQEQEKNVSQLIGSGKNWFLLISCLTNTVAAIWSEKKVDPCYLEIKKCSSQLLGARKKIMTYLKSEKLVPAIWKWKKLVPSYFEPDKHSCSYLEREKSGSLLFGDLNMQFTTVRRKEKYYYIYLKSEKLVPAIWKWKKLVPSYFEPDKHSYSYLEREKSGSLVFGD